MNDERWAELVGRIKDTFPVEEEYSRPTEGVPGVVEGIVFTQPGGKRRLERTTAAVIVETRNVGVKRGGAGVHLQHEYSEDETRSSVRLEEWNDGEWVEVDLSKLL